MKRLRVVGSASVRLADRRQPVRSAAHGVPDRAKGRGGVLTEPLPVHEELDVGDGAGRQIGPGRNRDGIGGPEVQIRAVQRQEQSDSDILDKNIHRGRGIALARVVKRHDVEAVRADERVGGHGGEGGACARSERDAPAVEIDSGSRRVGKVGADVGGERNRVAQGEHRAIGR